MFSFFVGVIIGNFMGVILSALMCASSESSRKIDEDEKEK